MATQSETSIHIDDPWFNYIVEGRKTVEGKLAKGKALKMSVGTVIHITGNSGTTVRARVRDVRKYASFIEYLTNEGLERTLPGVSSIEEGLKVYYQYYSPGSDLELGVLAIELQIVS